MCEGGGSDRPPDYGSPVALEHMASPWQHHLAQQQQHAFSPAGTSGNQQQQDRSFKTEPEQHGGGGNGPPGFRGNESVAVNEGNRVCVLIRIYSYV